MFRANDPGKLTMPDDSDDLRQWDGFSPGIPFLKEHNSVTELAKTFKYHLMN